MLLPRKSWQGHSRRSLRLHAPLGHRRSSVLHQRPQRKCEKCAQTQPAGTNQGTHRLHATIEIGHHNEDHRHIFLTPVHHQHQSEVRPVRQARWQSSNGVLPRPSPGKTASKRWRPSWVAPPGVDLDDDPVEDTSGQWRDHYRQSTPQQISSDLTTLRKNWKLTTGRLGSTHPSCQSMTQLKNTTHKERVRQQSSVQVSTFGVVAVSHLKRSYKHNKAAVRNRKPTRPLK